MWSMHNGHATCPMRTMSLPRNRFDVLCIIIIIITKGNVLNVYSW